MAKLTDAVPPEWNLGDWEKALTIRVGTAHACHKCGNLVMVTRGGVGIMELKCCGQVMETVNLGPNAPKGKP